MGLCINEWAREWIELCVWNEMKLFKQPYVKKEVRKKAELKSKEIV